MNLLNEKIKPLYFKYLSTAFGSALITSVYSIVDMRWSGNITGRRERRRWPSSRRSGTSSTASGC